MKILVDRLSTTPSEYDFRVDEGWWVQRFPEGSSAPETGLATPLGVHVEAHMMGEDLFLAGTIDGELHLECGRCLARYRQRLQESFQLVAEPAGTRAPGDPEAAEAHHGDQPCSRPCR